jgi:ornithine cyclodeaminase/alanine dehydrogenase-like protein (mu-crystallin family)
MLVLDEADIAKLIDMDAALAAVRSSLRHVYRGREVNLAKERASLDGQTLHSTGAVLRTGVLAPDAATAADTWHGATVYVSGTVRAHWSLVFNGDEGLRAAVAGKLLARLRTGAASGVSAAALAHRGPITLASIGAGYQAWTQVEAVSRVREISALRVWSRTRERAEQFAVQVRDGLGLPATPAATVAEAVAGADVVTAATKARDPIVLGRDVAPGTHVVLAGSSHVDRREADSELFRRAGAVYADDVELARAHSGDVRTAVRDGALAWDDVQHLGAALEEPETIPSGDPITVFCSHGVGSWDLELAMIAVGRAEVAGVGHRLDLDMGQWRGGM